jgi:hypothetical protein
MGLMGTRQGRQAKECKTMFGSGGGRHGKVTYYTWKGMGENGTWRKVEHDGGEDGVKKPDADGGLGKQGNFGAGH